MTQCTTIADVFSAAPSAASPRLRRLRRFAQHGLARALYHSGAIALARRALQRRGAVIVLALHRVLNESDYQASQSLKAIIVRRRTFEALLAYATRTCEFVDAVSVWPGRTASRAMLALTFDDGWADNLQHALPALTTHATPATVFLCTGVSASVSPFWPERVAGALRARFSAADEAVIERAVDACKHLSPEQIERQLGECSVAVEPATADRTMTWDEIAQMRAAGVRFGAHTHTHPILTRVPIERASAEARQSKQEVEAKLGEPCSAFAYPNGDWSPMVAAAVRAEGFRRAFTMQRAPWLRDSDQFAIPRLNVQEEDLVGLNGQFSAAMFEYTTFWKSWLALRRRAVVTRETSL